MKHRFARLAVSGVCVVVLMSAVAASTSSASPIEAKKAQAAHLQAQIDANGEKISALAEKYNEAQMQLDAAHQAIARLTVRLQESQRRSDHIAKLVAKRAANLYMGAGTATPLDGLDIAAANGFNVRAKYAETTTAQDNRLLDDLTAARQDMNAQKQDLNNAEKQAQQQVDNLASSRHDIEAANAEQEHLLSQVKGEIAVLIRQDEARRAAEERARAAEMARQMQLAAQQAAAQAAQQAAAQQAAAQSNSNSGGTSNGGSTSNGGGFVAGTDPGNVPIPNVPAPSPGAATAVAYAKAQLGKPYRYAGVGPDAYDCSGLTMMAWAQAGVSMPHGSIAQGNMFPRVPNDQLQPGDLAIYYPDHHHVGMYVGGGMTVSATHTGDFVRLQPVFRDGFQYAVRPG